MALGRLLSVYAVEWLSKLLKVTITTMIAVLMSLKSHYLRSWYQNLWIIIILNAYYPTLDRPPFVFITMYLIRPLCGLCLFL